MCEAFLEYIVSARENPQGLSVRKTNENKKIYSERT